MKPLRRLARITISTLGGLVVVVGLFVVVYFGELYISVTEKRSSSEPETVKVRWYLSCEKGYYEDENDNFYDPHVPIGGVYPGVGPVMSSGTKFILVGYPYKELRRNIFTGSVNEQRSDRIDVIEWKVVTPYITLEDGKYIEINKPLGWKSDKTEPQFITQLDRRSKGDC